MVCIVIFFNFQVKYDGTLFEKESRSFKLNFVFVLFVFFLKGVFLSGGWGFLILFLVTITTF